jgi:hypothetical protein
MWTQDTLEKYIKNKIQENLNLEYKAAGSFAKTEDKKTEITKDISAMANSAGGIVIYGIKEHKQKQKKYLPEKIDPIDRTKFSREWLEQVISNIQPRIFGLIINPVDITTSPNHTAYVVEIPSSMTAHQAMDKRYYKRYNFQCLAMEDYEIRDVMNRATYSDVNIEFALHAVFVQGEKEGSDPTPCRELMIIVKNEGTRVVNRYKLTLLMENVIWQGDDEESQTVFVQIPGPKNHELTTKYIFHSMQIVFQPETVLFPQERIDVGRIIGYGYPDPENSPFSGTEIDHDKRWRTHAEESHWLIRWKLHADNMPMKQGVIKVWELPLLTVAQAMSDS